MKKIKIGKIQAEVTFTEDLDEAQAEALYAWILSLLVGASESQGLAVASVLVDGEPCTLRKIKIATGEEKWAVN